MKTGSILGPFAFEPSDQALILWTYLPLGSPDFSVCGLSCADGLQGCRDLQQRRHSSAWKIWPDSCMSSSSICSKHRGLIGICEEEEQPSVMDKAYAVGVKCKAIDLV